MSRLRMSLFVLAALILGCSKASGPSTPMAVEMEGAGPTVPPAVSKTFAGLLPRETIAYLRLRDPATLAERCIAPTALTDAGPIQEQVKQWYGTAVTMAGQQNPFGLPPETVKELVANLRGVHVAVVADEQRIQEPVIFIDVMNPAVAAQVRAKLAERAAEKELAGIKVLDLAKVLPPGPAPKALCLLDGTLLIVGPEPVLASVIAAHGRSSAGSLAQSAGFRQAEADFGSAGDLFAYVNIADFRAALIRETSAKAPSPAEEQEVARKRELDQRRRAEIENMPFKEIGHAGGALAADGSFTIRAYASPGKKLPEFLVRRPAEKKLFRRIPADAVLAYGWTYEGGKHTRKSFVDWLKEEMKSDGAPFAPPMARVLTQELERLESDVVVIAQDLWMAVLPVKTELAFAAAPDAAGRWGALLAFDIEDRSQAEKLRQQIFEAGKRADLPWKETDDEGLKIRYLDVEEMVKAKGGSLPAELASQVQLKVGYAMGEELFMVGTVEAIKFAHRPSGPVLGDVIKRDNIDPANAFHMTLQPGRLVHGSTRIPATEKLMPLLRRRLPKDASWSITLNLEETQATLRSNVPFPAVAAWIAMDFDEFGKALR